MTIEWSSSSHNKLDMNRKRNRKKKYKIETSRRTILSLFIRFASSLTLTRNEINNFNKIRFQTNSCLAARVQRHEMVVH